MCTITEDPDPAGDGNKSDEQYESYNLLESGVDSIVWSSPSCSRCFDDEGAPRRRLVAFWRWSLQGYSVSIELVENSKKAGWFHGQMLTDTLRGFYVIIV